jgi:hypothetical protein
MRMNMGTKDRRVRSFLVAPLLVVVAVVFHDVVWLMLVLLFLAVLAWATSVTRTCPLYLPFKFSTVRK